MPILPLVARWRGAGGPSGSEASSGPSLAEERPLEPARSPVPDSVTCPSGLSQKTKPLKSHDELPHRLGDWQGLSKLNEGTVLHIWRRSDRCPDCKTCAFFEHEIERVGRFNARVAHIRRFVNAYTALKGWVDQTTFERNIQRVGDQDEPDWNMSDHGSKLAEEECLICSTQKASSLSKGVEDLDPASAYLFSMDVVDAVDTTRRYHSFSSTDKILDPILLKGRAALVIMKGTLGTHPRSESCLVCEIISGHRQDPEDIIALIQRYDVLSLPQRRDLVRYHKLPFPPGRNFESENIRQVTMEVVQKRSWHGLALIEHKRSAKHPWAHRDLDSAPRSPFLSYYRRRIETLLSQELETTSAADSSSATDAHGPENGSGSSALSSLGTARVDEAPQEEHLEKAYRQHSKDLEAFIPQSGDYVGSARPVKAKFDINLINFWLTSCQAKHGTACKREKELTAPQGMILIDTEDMCLRYVGGERLPSYFALSYVWGAVAQPVLTSQNLESWKQPGALQLSAIPTTVRDAIVLTKGSGLRYLWVDAMCIVQDDLELRSIQIQQMYLIYHQAELTIVDGSGSDCMNGLAGVSDLEGRFDKETTYTIGGVNLCRVLQEPRYSLEASPWRTRGWTFQEELCSRRAVIFLPNVVLFSCTESVWREDICLEDEPGPTCKPSGYLNSLPAPSVDRMEPEERVSIFRDLVKQFIKRVLTRIDDIENAFAGIAGMLEYAIGPLYHGIPEKDFVHVIDGCWFWNMGFRQRPGFSSWSWTGWIYAPEQADTGIAPLTNLGTTVGLLQFYKLEGEVAQPLYSGGPSNLPTRAELREHFTPGKFDLNLRLYEEDSGREGPTRGLIGFFTSLLYLRLRAPRGLGAGRFREFSVCDPNTGDVLTTLTLPEDFLKGRATLQPFIAVAYSSGTQSFRLMLVELDHGICTKVNVTAPRRMIHEDKWWSLGPEKKLIIMN